MPTKRIPEKGSCSICADPEKMRFVNRAFNAGHKPTRIEILTRQPDSPVPVIKEETVRRHVSQHLHRPVGSVAQKMADMVTVQHAPTPKERQDVAVLVQEEVVRRLQDGEARVTVQHGLQAQALLDRREERKQDRALAITLARILHTQAPPAQVVGARDEPIVIEGEARTVS